MQINLKGTKIDLTSEIKDYVQKKMDMLEKYLGGIQVINADFEVEQITKHHQKGEIFRAEANLEIPGKLLRVEKTEDEIFKAIDKAKDRLAEIIKEHKEKMIDRRRK